VDFALDRTYWRGTRMRSSFTRLTIQNVGAAIQALERTAASTIFFPPLQAGQAREILVLAFIPFPVDPPRCHAVCQLRFGVSRVLPPDRRPRWRTVPKKRRRTLMFGHHAHRRRDDADSQTRARSKKHSESGKIHCLNKLQSIRARTGEMSPSLPALTVACSDNDLPRFRMFLDRARV